MVSGTIIGDEVEVKPKKSQKVVFDRIPAKVIIVTIFIVSTNIKFYVIVDFKARY